MPIVLVPGGLSSSDNLPITLAPEDFELDDPDANRKVLNRVLFLMRLFLNIYRWQSFNCLANSNLDNASPTALGLGFLA